jgi:hypothetical protein
LGTYQERETRLRRLKIRLVPRVGHAENRTETALGKRACGFLWRNPLVSRNATATVRKGVIGSGLRLKTDISPDMPLPFPVVSSSFGVAAALAPTRLVLRNPSGGAFSPCPHLFSQRLQCLTILFRMANRATRANVKARDRDNASSETRSTTRERVLETTSRNRFVG